MRKKRSFFDSAHCQSKAHCKACRLNHDWRSSMTEGYNLPEVDFACPFGETAESVMRLPSLAKQVFNLLQSVWRCALAAIGKWQIRASERERERRMSICQARSAECFRARDKRCSTCGCYIPAKAALKPETCPAGHW